MAKRARNKTAIAGLEKKLEGIEVADGMALYVNAYLDLDTERHAEMLPIPWSKIVGYCVHYGLSERQTEYMIGYVRFIDNAEREKRQKDAERNAARSSK